MMLRIDRRTHYPDPPIGARFGYLVVAGRRVREKGDITRIPCVCDCGKQRLAGVSRLRRGMVNSCGCSRMLKHGYTGTPEYSAWTNMLLRCNKPSHPCYAYYGGRGITVTARWSEFKNFITDMGDRPSSKHSLDRIDNDAGYSPGNCRWATRREQLLNRRMTRRATVDGITRVGAEWDALMGLREGTVRERLNRGWSDAEAVLTPHKGRR